MPRKKYNFEPKTFERYQKETGSSIEEHESRLNTERSESDEGDFIRDHKDVKEDYWRDVARAKRDAPEPPPRKSRPYKNPKRMIKNWDKRKASRRSYR
jgi:hypothetical protein